MPRSPKSAPPTTNAPPESPAWAASNSQTAFLLEEIGALKARLAARSDETRALKADIAARDVLIARLRAGEDPVGVYPSGLGSHDAPKLDRAAPVRRAVEPIVEAIDRLRADLARQGDLLVAARLDIAERDRVITELRSNGERVAIRLAEVDTLYKEALEAVRERGAAQTDALTAYQDIAGQLAGARALLSARDEALLGANAEVRRLTDLIASKAIEAAREPVPPDPIAVDHLATVAACIADMSARIDRQRADFGSYATLLQAARIDLGERDRVVTELRLQLERTSVRLAEVDTLYKEALEAVRERGAAQTDALTAYQDLARQFARSEALISARDEDLRAAKAEVRRLTDLLASRATEPALATGIADLSARLEQQQANMGSYATLLQAARLDLADRDRVITELRLQLERTSVRLAEVNGLYLNALEVVRERGEGQATALAERQAIAERLAATEALLAERGAALERVLVEITRPTPMTGTQSMSVELPSPEPAGADQTPSGPSPVLSESAAPPAPNGPMDTFHGPWPIEPPPALASASIKRRKSPSGGTTRKTKG